MRKEVDTMIEKKNELTREDLYYELFDFFEAAGFWRDELEEELYKLKTSKTRDEYIANRVKEFMLNKNI